MLIQKAEEKHLDDITRIWIDLMLYHAGLDPFWELSDDAIDNFTKWMAGEIKNDDSCILVAVIDDKVAGYIGGRVNNHPPVLREIKHILITDMVVDNPYRRIGTGEALIEKLLKWTKDKGLKRVELGVAPKNNMGLNFWKKMGFSEYLIMMARED